jgi:Family of unknown function (DUF5924)
VLRLPRVLTSVTAFLERHDRLLWGVHSLWALALGVVVMWAGARNYSWLRVTIFYVAFLWVTSLVVPALVDEPGAGTRWRGRLRLVINYFSKNFYQQLLFFLLPVYYASASAWSANLLFVAFLAASALISTMDVFYDRHLSVRRGLAAIFFAFNLFACINVMLPVLWSISNRVALPVSAALAVLAFATIRYRRGELARFHVRQNVGLAGIALILLVAIGRPLIPPAPLRVLKAEFGEGIDRRALQVTAPLAALPVGWSGRVYAVTAIYAPLGLRDRIGHRWYEDGGLVYASPFYRLEGGRPGGFRLWTSAPVRAVGPGTILRVDVVTEAGQLVGRAAIDGGRDRARPAGPVR